MLFDKTDSERIYNMRDKDAKLITESLLSEVLTDKEIKELTESTINANALVNNQVITEKSLMRLSNTSKVSTAFKTSVYTIARENADPDFKKLLTVWKMSRALESSLCKKYGSEASKRTKLVVSRLVSAKKAMKSNLLDKAVAVAQEQFDVK
jgi:hypothetical protein